MSLSLSFANKKEGWEEGGKRGVMHALFLEKLERNGMRMIMIMFDGSSKDDTKFHELLATDDLTCIFLISLACNTLLW